MQYLIPIFFAFIFIYAIIKKVPLYDSFIEGAKGAIPFAMGIFPYLACIFILNYLFEVSGISALLIKLLSPLFSLFQIPYASHGAIQQKQTSRQSQTQRRQMLPDSLSLKQSYLDNTLSYSSCTAQMKPKSIIQF